MSNISFEKGAIHGEEYVDLQTFVDSEAKLF